MDNPKQTIVLVNVINSIGAGKVRIPVGLIYLGSALKKQGYNVKIYQPFLNEEDIQDVEQRIIEHDPLFVGFSVFMGPGSVTSLDMSERLKRALNTKIVWGGKFATSISETS